MKIRGLDSVIKALAQEKEKIHNTIIKELSKVGNKAYRHSVDRPQADSWFNISGDLRSSIGYGISYNGAIVKMGGFERVKIGKKGVEMGKALVVKELSKQTKGYNMAIVVGMPYAEKLEMIKGVSILDGAELVAEREIMIMGQTIKITSVKL